MSLALSGSETLRLAARARRHPDGRTILVLALIYSGNDKGHVLAVGRDTRSAKKFDLVQVLHSD
jgi:hypothetical protein